MSKVDQVYSCCSQCRGLFTRARAFHQHKFVCTGNVVNSKCSHVAVDKEHYLHLTQSMVADIPGGTSVKEQPKRLQSELDGSAGQRDDEMERVVDICKSRDSQKVIAVAKQGERPSEHLPPSVHNQAKDSSPIEADSSVKIGNRMNASGTATDTMESLGLCYNADHPNETGLNVQSDGATTNTDDSSDVSSMKAHSNTFHQNLNESEVEGSQSRDCVQNSPCGESGENAQSSDPKTQSTMAVDSTTAVSNKCVSSSRGHRSTARATKHVAKPPEIYKNTRSSGKISRQQRQTDDEDHSNIKPIDKPHDLKQSPVQPPSVGVAKKIYHLYEKSNSIVDDSSMTLELDCDGEQMDCETTLSEPMADDSGGVPSSGSKYQLNVDILPENNVNDYSGGIFLETEHDGCKDNGIASGDITGEEAEPTVKNVTVEGIEGIKIIIGPGTPAQPADSAGEDHVPEGEAVSEHTATDDASSVIEQAEAKQEYGSLAQELSGKPGKMELIPTESFKTELRDNGNNEYSCIDCDFTASDLNLVVEHTAIHRRPTRDKFKNNIHEEMSASKRWKQKAGGNSGSNTARYKCNVCSYTSNMIGMYQRHLKSHNNGSSFCCDICGEEFLYRRLYNTHVNKHKGFKCPECPRVFGRRHDCDRHVTLLHRGQRNMFQCSVCNYTTTYKHFMKEHQRKHTGEMLRCDEGNCDFSTIYGRALSHHKNTVHATEKSLVCGICKYSTNDRGCMQRHMRIHTHMKIYKCSQCDYRSYEAGYVRSHMLTHSDRKIYQCNQCDYATARPSGMRMHMIKHTGIHPWQCPGCKYTSLSKDKVARHIKLRHDGVGKPIYRNIKLKVDVNAFKMNSIVDLDVSNEEEVEADYLESEDNEDMQEFLIIEQVPQDAISEDILNTDNLEQEEHIVEEKSIVEGDAAETQEGAENPDLSCLYKCAFCDYMDQSMDAVQEHISDAHSEHEDQSGDTAATDVNPDVIIEGVDQNILLEDTVSAHKVLHWSVKSVKDIIDVQQTAEADDKVVTFTVPQTLPSAVVVEKQPEAVENVLPEGVTVVETDMVTSLDENEVISSDIVVVADSEDVSGTDAVAVSSAVHPDEAVSTAIESILFLGSAVQS